MEELQKRPIRLLVVEDTRADAERAAHQFTRAGVPWELRRVETGEALRSALAEFSPTLILSDFTLPQFDGLSALEICRELAPDVPFIFVSGTIGEERAISALKAGAADYVLKENMARLVPAAERAISDAAARDEKRRQQAQIARLNRVLRMLKGVNDVVMRCRDRTELLRESCRVAISLGGYAMAAVAGGGGGGAAIKALAADGMDAEAIASLERGAQDAVASTSGMLSRVLASGSEHVCNDTADLESTARFDSLLVSNGLRSVVALPLTVDGRTTAALLLAAREPGLLGEEELGMLRDLARSLSFGLQYVQRDIHSRFLSHFHPQTGLARRSLFCDRLRELIASDPARVRRLAVVVIDMRKLGAINDAFGRHTGDLLLRQVGETLKRNGQGVEQPGHFGNGAFALVLELEGLTPAELVVQRQLRQLFGRPFDVERHSIPLSVRAGCALYPDDGADAALLVQNAETALHVARAGGGEFARFDPAARLQSVGQLAMEHRLRHALENGQFELHYQPKVNVVTRRIQGAEALLRWRCPEEGLLAPASFLPVLESSGLILSVGDWVVNQAVADCRRWMENGVPTVRVAVNIAPAQLRQVDFEERFLRQLQGWAGRIYGLDIEITEGVLQDDCEAEIRKLERLRAAGIRIAIDDFGTGYSSLSRLAHLPVDTLKIDRSFVAQAVGNPAGAAVVRTVVSLARAFNMTSVAEGVERQEELDLLWHMGCDQSQGHLHSVALPPDEFATLLRQGKGVLVQPPAEEDQDDWGAAATGS
ncbi:MAG TPA: EAL domain-containing protein [Steroidobacteraceae bacterium]|nr:EAL domain-containing protein [Steroidobacteraceae bacterium]